MMKKTNLKALLGGAALILLSALPAQASSTTPDDDFYDNLFANFISSAAVPSDPTAKSLRAVVVRPMTNVVANEELENTRLVQQNAQLQQQLQETQSKLDEAVRELQEGKAVHAKTLEELRKLHKDHEAQGQKLVAAQQATVELQEKLNLLKGAGSPAASSSLANARPQLANVTSVQEAMSSGTSQEPAEGIELTTPPASPRGGGTSGAPAAQ